MLTPYKIEDYCKEFSPQWVCQMPEGCPPDDILVASEHPFYRLAQQAAVYDVTDFLSYSEIDPSRNWGSLFHLSLILLMV